MNNENQQKSLITIIIPCYNASSTLERCLDSYLEQTWKDSHGNEVGAKDNSAVCIVIVDDCSDDDGKTNHVCKKYSRYSNVRYIRLEQNVGQAGARNHALSKVQSRYVMFADADDYSEPGLLDCVFSSIALHSDCDVLIWGANEIHCDAAGNIQKTVTFLPDTQQCNNIKEITKLAVKLEESTLFGYLWNKLFKVSLIKDNIIKIPNEHLIEDEIFNILYFKKAKTAITVSKTFYNYIRQSGSGTVTTSYLPDYFEQYSRRVKLLYEWFEETGALNEYALKVLANEYMRFGFSAMWRNSDKNSGMNKQEQSIWIKSFLNDDFTKTLIVFAKPDGNVAKIMLSIAKTRNVWLLRKQAQLIGFVTNNMGNLLIKLRQSR